MSFLLKPSYTNGTTLNGTTNLTPSLCPPPFPLHSASPAINKTQSLSPSSSTDNPREDVASPHTTVAKGEDASSHHSNRSAPVVPAKPARLRINTNGSHSNETLKTSTSPVTPAGSTTFCPAAATTSTNPAPEFLSDLAYNPNCLSVKLMQEPKLSFEQGCNI